MADSQRVAEHTGIEPETLEPFDDRLTFVGRVLGVTASRQHDHVCHDVESWGDQEGVVSEAMPSASVLGLWAVRLAMATTLSWAPRVGIARTCHSSNPMPPDHSVMR